VKNLEIDKAQVALRFAQAGQSYSEHAVVQKQIARQLFNLIQGYAAKTQFERVFEIGCGSGNLSHLLLNDFQIQHYLLNDLYAEVQQHFQGYSNIDWLLGDIEQLNFPSDLELIVSTSALQWMTNLDAVFQKANDSLLPHGLFCFSTFGDRYQLTGTFRADGSSRFSKNKWGFFPSVAAAGFPPRPGA
jgi:malonyl-CoA O-methyltransferase